MSPLQKLTIRSDGSPTHTTVELDGLNIARSLKSLSLDLSSDDIPTAYLTLYVEVDAEVAAEIRRDFVFPQLEQS